MDRKPAKKNPDMEGEGNKTADAAYRKGATQFAHSGKVDAGAKEAVRALDEDAKDGAPLQRAVEESRKPGADDLPKDLQKKKRN